MKKSCVRVVACSLQDGELCPWREGGWQCLATSTRRSWLSWRLGTAVLAFGLLKSPCRPSYRQVYPQSHLPPRDPQGSSDRRDGAGGGGRPGQASGSGREQAGQWGDDHSVGPSPVGLDSFRLFG